MIEFLKQYSMPVRYAIIGFAAGFVWFFVAMVAGYDLQNAFAAMLGLTVGGGVAGWLQRDSDRDT